MYMLRPLLSGIFFLFSSLCLSAQWTQLYAPGNTAATSFHRFEEHLILYSTEISEWSLYHSQDDGRSWDIVPSPVQVIANYNPRFGYDGTYFYVFLANSGLYRSTDWGNTWEKITSAQPGPGNPTLDDLAITGGYIFYDVEGSVYRLATSSGAMAQEVLETPVQYPDMVLLRVRGNDLWASANDSLLRSSDQGVTWNLIWEGDKIEDFDLGGDTILVKTISGYWRTDNYGVDWALVSSLDYGNRLSYSSDNWFAYSTYSSGLFRSVDQGVSWNIMPDSLGAILTNNRPLKKGDQIIIPGFQGPIVSYDNGLNWEYQTRGLRYYSIFGQAEFTLLDQVLYLNKQFSEDNGNTWFLPLISGVYEHLFLRVCAFKGSYFGITNGYKLYRSDGNLREWTLLPLQLSSNNLVNFMVTDSILYLKTSDSVYETLDMGQTWTYKGGNTLTTPIGHKNALFHYAYDRLNRSDDGGITWFETAADLLPYEFNTSVKLFSAGNTLYMYDTRVILASKDDGETFVQVNTNLLEPVSGRPTGASAFAATDSMIAITNGFGLFYAPNSFSDQWISLYDNINTDLPALFSTPLFVEDTLFVAGFSGLKYLWKQSTKTIKSFSGTVYMDHNNNGQRDSTEAVQPRAILRLEEDQFFNAGADGYYAMDVSTPGDTLRVLSPSPHAVINPPYYLVQNEGVGQDFGIYMPSDITDMRITLTNETVFRPGFNNSINIHYANLGGDTLQPKIRFFSAPSFTIISTNPSATESIGDTLYWDLQEVYPLAVGSIEINIQLEANTQLGSEIHVFSAIETTKLDVDLSNNADTINEVVVGSYDPNDKTCLNGDHLSPEEASSRTPLEYIVRFQNTGSYYAEVVRLADQLDKQLDPATFEFLGSSHPCQVSIRDGGKVEFLFTGIKLLSSNQNEPESHGFVRFRVQPKAGLVIGDTLSNLAEIYFDFNAPILTNTVLTIVGTPISTNSPETSPRFQISPNPATDILRIDCNYGAYARLRLLDPHGRPVQEFLKPTFPLTTHISSYPKGIYWVEITGSNGNIFFEKLILH